VNAFLVNQLGSYHFAHIILISIQQENSELQITVMVATLYWSYSAGVSLYYLTPKRFPHCRCHWPSSWGCREWWESKEVPRRWRGSKWRRKSMRDGMRACAAVRTATPSESWPCVRSPREAWILALGRRCRPYPRHDEHKQAPCPSPRALKFQGPPSRPPHSPPPKSSDLPLIKSKKRKRKVGDAPAVIEPPNFASILFDLFSVYLLCFQQHADLLPCLPIVLPF